MPATSLADRALRVARVDRAPRHLPPSRDRLLLATLLAVAGSLLADALLVFIGTTEFPATKSFVHFRVADYAALTILGVLVACTTWPGVNRLTSTPRWLFFRLAVIVTLGLWLPDLWLIVRHEPVRAVGVLMVMHVAVALITYNSLVRIAPVRPLPTSALLLNQPAPSTQREKDSTGSPVGLATALSILVGVEFVLGIVSLFLLRVGRPSGWLPLKGAPIYLAHAIIGVPLAVGAVNLFIRVRTSTRTHRMVGWTGIVGVGMAGFGGLLTEAKPLRLIGMALMLVGPLIAGFGYLIPMLDRLPRAPTSPYGSGEPQAVPQTQTQAQTQAQAQARSQSRSQAQAQAQAQAQGQWPAAARSQWPSQSGRKSRRQS
ncbi:MAG: hypothetical protein ACYCSF_05335 [Acidimicrobiales bacterium]